MPIKAQIYPWAEVSFGATWFACKCSRRQYGSEYQPCKNEM